MLGPVEEAAANPAIPATSAYAARSGATQCAQIAEARHSLLDFSRIEAGRVQACYEPTDFGVLTGDLASNFRSAIERAAVALEVDCERFHRVEGTPGRTREGSGVGLALVRELVQLHGGSISAESQLGHGTTFRVAVPLGGAHLPAARIKVPRTLSSTAIGARAFVEEALRWIPEQHVSADLAGGGGDSPRAAMADGEQALEAARRKRPDLILSEIMMPRRTGLELLQALRADESLRDVPVILLSARAGEEARLEGLDAGADDSADRAHGIWPGGGSPACAGCGVRCAPGQAGGSAGARAHRRRALERPVGNQLSAPLPICDWQ